MGISLVAVGILVGVESLESAFRRLRTGVHSHAPRRGGRAGHDPDEAPDRPARR